jgi:L-Lysine epsilon oxidase N-terminal/L-lysine epsilon oxidase C-terminal domain
MPNLRIYPAVGVARIGNSAEFFVGPEIPGIPGNWDSDNNVFKKFKDAEGKVLRQAARFRIFEFDDGGNPVKEVTLTDGVKIEWRVHVANRKASFFSFHGQSGAETNPPYTDRDRRPPDSVERKERGRGEPELKNKRNAGVADRRSLEIDPGIVSISSPGSVDLIDSQTAAPIKSLGQLRMEAEGRLLFLGGSGESASSATPAPPIEDYANNDTWFDDMCDGVIQASVTLPSGEVQIAQSAWIIVGPPKFAPGIRNVVSLYDLLWDLAVRLRLACQPSNDPMLQDLVSQQQTWQDATNDFAPSYVPSFMTHIYPVLSRALAAYDVQVTIRRDAHATFADWTRLSKANDDAAQMRQSVFRRVRDPNSKALDRMNMPRGLGDDYTSLDDFENGLADAPLPGAFLSLTRVQYALLKAWAEGKFKEDWTFGDVTYAPIPAPTPVTPHGLDCAALENCVGGPFYPGIEVSWLIRTPELYAAAFRLKEPGFAIGPLVFQAGFFSQQMALPWHADFYDCHKEDHTTDDAPESLVYMWWTAQRPDDIRSEEDGPFRRWVAPFDAFKEPDADDPDDLANLARFEQMRTRWSELSFIVLTGDEHLEQK